MSFVHLIFQLIDKSALFSKRFDLIQKTFFFQKRIKRRTSVYIFGHNYLLFFLDSRSALIHFFIRSYANSTSCAGVFSLFLWKKETSTILSPLTKKAP